MKSYFSLFSAIIIILFFNTSSAIFSQDFNTLNKISTHNDAKVQGTENHTDNYGAPHYFKGVVYVKLKVNDVVLPFKDDKTQRNYSFTFGLKTLDKFVKTKGVTRIEQVFPKAKKLSERIFSRPQVNTNQLPDLSNIYMLYFSYDEDPVVISRELSKYPEVEYAEPVPVTYPLEIPNDTRYGEQQHLPQMQCPEAWNLHKGENSDGSVIIGICDTGVDWKHPDLINNIYQKLGEDADKDGHVLEYINGTWQFDPGDINGVDDDGNGYVDDFIGWNFYPDDGTPVNDPMGSAKNTHGTHCAGISAGVTNNANGIASVSWNLKFMATKHGSNAAGNAIYNGFDGIVYLAENGADVINCSWGGSGYSQTGQLAINYATSLGAIVVAAAGNNNSSVPFYPAAYQNIISVASVAVNDKKAYYSNYGYTVDVSAPGGDAYVDGGILSTVPNNNYAKYQGTSMASPQVTGLIGLVKSYLPNKSNDVIIRRVVGNVDNIENLNPGYPGMLGNGRVNAYKALLNDFTGKFPLKIVFNSVIHKKTGNVYEISYNIFNYSEDGANSVKFTLSSTDSKINIVNPTGYSSVAQNGPTRTGFINSFQIIQNSNSFATLHLHLEGIDNPIKAGTDFDFQVYCGQNGILVFEKYNNGPTTSGIFIKNYLTTNNYPNIVYTNSAITNLIGFDYLFLSMGNANSYDYAMLDNNLAEHLQNFLENGGRVYLESGDALGYEQEGNHTLLSLFGIANGYDGARSHTFAGLTGNAGTVTEGMQFNQTTQNPYGWIDYFEPSTTGKVAFFEPGVGNVAIQNTGSYGQRTFAFSYAISKLVDGNSPSTRNTLLQRILDFFSVYNQVPNQVVLSNPASNSNFYPGSQLNFEWNSLSNAWDYELQIAKDNDFSNIVFDVQISDTNKTYSHNQFTLNTNYYWRVRARNNMGYGNWSEVWDFRINEQLPAKVILTSPSNHSTINTLTPTFTWQAIQNANYYTIQIFNDAQFTNNFLTESGITSTSFTPSIPLIHNKTYYWRVRATNGGGDGDWSDARALNIYMCAKSVSLDLPMNNAQDLDITPTFNWAEDQYATSYNLQLSTNQYFATITANYSNITTNQYILANNLNYNTTYYWRVRSHNNCGYSSWSETFKFTTKDLPFEINLSNKSTCKSQSVELGTKDENGDIVTVTGGSGYFQYNWYPNTNLLNSNTGNPTASNPMITTTYLLTVKDLITGVTKTASMTLTVYPSINITMPLFATMKFGSFLNLNTKIQNISGGNPPYVTVWTDRNGNVVNPPIISPAIGAHSYWINVSDASSCTVNKRLVIFVTSNKSADDEITIAGEYGNNLIATFPSPVKNELNVIYYSIENQKADWTISNLIGQEFLKGELFGNTEKIIDMSNLPAGIYILRLNCGNEILTQKIIKN